MIHIQTPATTANMGPGFDSIGMAFRLYNHVWVEQQEQELTVQLKTKNKFIPLDKRNLIYKSIVRFYQETGKGKVPGLRLIQEDHIPMTRGLGSSACCIVSGLLAANELSGARLSKEDLCTMAALIEGHPDNSTPALVGGITVGAINGASLSYIQLPVPHLNKLKFAVMIPDFHLSTEKARMALPDEYKLADAVYNLSRASLMVAAFATGDFSKLKVAMGDRLHQPYRMPLIPEMDNILQACEAYGCLGAFLSGAGPTLIAIVNDDSFMDKIKGFTKNLQNRWTIQYLEPDFNGAVVTVE